MDWHDKLCGQSITHRDLDNLGISVENLRKTNALNNNKLNRYNRHQIIKASSIDLEDEFILFKK